MSYVVTSKYLRAVVKAQNYDAYFTGWDVSPYRKRSVMENAYNHFLADSEKYGPYYALRQACEFFLSRDIKPEVMGQAFSWMIEDLRRSGDLVLNEDVPSVSSLRRIASRFVEYYLLKQLGR